VRSDHGNHHDHLLLFPVVSPRGDFIIGQWGIDRWC
jgi:hypothetical protein